MGVPAPPAPVPQAARPGSRPDFAPTTLAGAIRYYDCQVDDARLVLTIARTAAAYGAHVATRVQGHRLPARGRAGRRRTRARPRDRARARGPGPRSSSTRPASGPTRSRRWSAAAARSHVEASKGIHLVVPRDRIRSEAGFITRTETSVLFVIPWGRHWIIGTTDTAWDLDKAHPAASRADIDYVLEHVNTILREPLDHEDVEGVYAGLRPLLSGESEPTSQDLPRAHGGHAGAGPGDDRRRQAHDVPRDGARRRRRRRPLARPRPTDRAATRITDRVPLLGRRRLRDPHQPAGRCWPAARACTSPASTTCSGRYGGLVDDLLALIAQRPELAAPLEGAEDYLAAEVVYAVTHEGARHLDDVLTRRTRISIETFDRGRRGRAGGRAS